ncbi:MAG: 2-methylfumaryl-CoA hydratase [Gammaproteobacteria bacterium]|jgi:2-methylfumaryl-CoA hydratase
MQHTAENLLVDLELVRTIPKRSAKTMAKTTRGRFFEDFRVGEVMRHATPRTVTDGDVSLYNALYGPRFAVQSSDEFARSLGLPCAPVDDFLTFHMVFGKSVPDVSLNAVANLGYANGRFAAPVYPGDTLSASSTVTGLKQNSNGKTGVVYVNTVGTNQDGEVVLQYDRWVMLHKRDPDCAVAKSTIPELPNAVSANEFVLPGALKRIDAYDYALAGSPYRLADYVVGEKIDHGAGITIEEAEHQMATRLYQNTAKVHFDQVSANAGRFKRRLIYGGHIISLARAMSFNGLENAFRVLAINGGAHCNPTFAGDTVFAYSEVLEHLDIPGFNHLGALRLRLVATKDRPAGDFPLRDDGGRYDPSVVLDLDYTVAMPR